MSNNMLPGSVKQINFVSFNQKTLTFFKTIPSFPSLRALESIKQCTGKKEIDGENKHSDNMTNLYNLVEISLFLYCCMNLSLEFCYLLW